MTKKELEAEVLSLRSDLGQLASIVSEIFVQTKVLKSTEPVNQEILRIVNNKSKNYKKYRDQEITQSLTKAKTIKK